MSDATCGVNADLWRRCVGSRKARRLPVCRSANLRTVRHLFDCGEVADFSKQEGVRHDTRTSAQQPSGTPPPSPDDLAEERHTMKPTGSFYPLAGDDAEAPAVLFAYAVDTPEQKRALHDEAMARLAAVSSLSDALLTMQVDDPGRRSHVRVMEAIAILSRDAKGLMEATVR